MRKFNETYVQQDYKIIAVDDEEGIIDSLSIVLKRSGYQFVGVTDPVEAIERIRNEHFDLLLLDFLMSPYHGDQVVEEIRKFNKELYILLLTGHKDLAPPLETIKKLDIQGYCEKGDKFDQLLLLIESGIKSIKQMREIQKINQELSEAKEQLEKAYLESIETLRYTVEAKDTYTRGHSDRVSEFSVLIGEKMGLSEDELKTLRIGGLFHDIGKIGIPDSILLKESKLSDDEYSEIKHHPSIGAHILSNATLFKDIITVKEELEHVKNYMIIESIRYKDTFTFTIDCDPDCEECLAMKLMLQPFVENSIYHGLKNLESEGKIHIKVYKKDDFIYYVVEDNGYGIRQEKIDELYERMHNNEVTNSVGIKNVYQRLKLYYGAEAEIFIESELDEYTRFIIKTPSIKEENKWEK